MAAGYGAAGQLSVKASLRNDLRRSRPGSPVAVPEAPRSGHGAATAQARPVPRILIALLLLLIVALQLKLWGREGMAKVEDLESTISAQRAENERLKARNAALEAEVINLKEAREAIEERARAELGLIAEDETFYHVIDGESVRAPEPESER